MIFTHRFLRFHTFYCLMKKLAFLCSNSKIKEVYDTSRENQLINNNAASCILNLNYACSMPPCKPIEKILTIKTNERDIHQQKIFVYACICIMCASLWMCKSVRVLFYLYKCVCVCACKNVQSERKRRMVVLGARAPDINWRWSYSR